MGYLTAGGKLWFYCVRMGQGSRYSQMSGEGGLRGECGGCVPGGGGARNVRNGRPHSNRGGGKATAVDRSIH